MTSSDISALQTTSNKFFCSIPTDHYVLSIESLSYGHPTRRVNVKFPKPYRLIVQRVVNSGRLSDTHAPERTPNNRNFMSMVFSKLGIDLRTHTKKAWAKFLEKQEILEPAVATAAYAVFEQRLHFISNTEIKELNEGKSIPLVDLDDLPEFLANSNSDDFIGPLEVLELILEAAGSVIIDTAKNFPAETKEKPKPAQPSLNYIHGAVSLKILGHEVGYLFVENDNPVNRISNPDLVATILACYQQQLTRLMSDWIDCGVSSDYNEEIRNAYLRQARVVRRIIKDIVTAKATGEVVMTIGCSYDRALSKTEYENMNNNLHTVYRSKNYTATHQLITEIMTKEGTIHPDGLCS